MKRDSAKHWLSLLVFGFAPMAGCYSDFPLDASPQLQLDQRLLGMWRCIPMGADETESATVTVDADSVQARSYVLNWQETGKDPESYQAFVSSVSGKTVLNVRERGKADGQWAFLRYALLRPNLVHLELVNYELFEGAESSHAAARAALKRGGTDDFDEFAVCVRTRTAKN